MPTGPVCARPGWQRAQAWRLCVADVTTGCILAAGCCIEGVARWCGRRSYILAAGRQGAARRVCDVSVWQACHATGGRVRAVDNASELEGVAQERRAIATMRRYPPPPPPRAPRGSPGGGGPPPPSIRPWPASPPPPPDTWSHGRSQCGHGRARTIVSMQATMPQAQQARAPLDLVNRARAALDGLSTIMIIMCRLLQRIAALCLGKAARTGVLPLSPRFPAEGTVVLAFTMGQGLALK